MSGPPNKASQRVLVVEDEFYIAEEVVAALVSAGLDVIGPASSVGEALRQADELLSRGVPLVITTGYDLKYVDPKYQHIDRFVKPFDPAAVVARLRQRMRL